MRTYVKILTCDGQLGHHCPIKFRFFLFEGEKMSCIAHLKLDDIPASGET